MGTYGVIDFDDEEIEAASHWYGGQGSMLYAITSTGSLKRGTIRPRHDDNTPMTDEEWIVDLAERLESEAEEAARDAGKQAKKAKGDEKKELLADQAGLRSIAFKTAQFVRDARRSKKSSHATKKSARQVKAREAPSRSRLATVIVYSRPSGYWYAQARDAATGAMVTDATGYSREGVLRELRGKFPMIGVTIKSITDEDPYAAAHAEKAAGRALHATKKTAAQLDREIAQTVGRRIDRKTLGEMMHPWSSVGYGPEGTAIYAVASHYDGGKKHPDRSVVERALRAIEADIPRAEHGAHGWTRADAKDLRTIAAGLRYYLRQDYGGSGTAHSTTKRGEELYPTAEARRQVQTIRRREDFPEILSISMRADGINYQVKVPDPKNPRGYDLVDVLVHHSGLRSIKSASRSRTTPDRASKIVTRYLSTTGGA